jgi:hypothetical protein
MAVAGVGSNTKRLHRPRGVPCPNHKGGLNVPIPGLSGLNASRVSTGHLSRTWLPAQPNSGGGYWLQHRTPPVCLPRPLEHSSISINVAGLDLCVGPSRHQKFEWQDEPPRRSRISARRAYLCYRRARGTRHATRSVIWAFTCDNAVLTDANQARRAAGRISIRGRECR